MRTWRGVLRVLLAGLALAAATALLGLLGRTAYAREPDIELFTRQGCGRCDAAKRYAEELVRAQPELAVEIVDVGRDAAARERLSKLVASRGIAAASVPAMLVRGTLVVGFTEGSTPARVEAALAGRAPSSDDPGETCAADAGEPCEGDAEAGGIVLPVFGRIELGRLGLPLFTLAGGDAYLVDTNLSFGAFVDGWGLDELFSTMADEPSLLHDDPRGLLVFPASVVTIGESYDEVVAEVGARGAWIDLEDAPASEPAPPAADDEVEGPDEPGDDDRPDPAIDALLAALLGRSDEESS